jgi:HAD superfamily hydrolase (TIGR01509 family)
VRGENAASRPVDAVVFDFDGLVVDTEAPVFEAWRAVFESHGCPPLTVEQWSLWIGRDTDNAEIIELLVAGASRPVDLEAMHATRRAHLSGLLSLEVVRPGVEAWLDEADRSGLGLAIASSSSDWWVLGHLERLGLRERFAYVACASATLAGKPAPDTYLAACAALEVVPRRAVAVEDSPNGIAAAKAAGLHCVAVPNPLTESLDLSAADLRLGSLADCSLAEAVTRVTR